MRRGLTAGASVLSLLLVAPSTASAAPAAEAKAAGSAAATGAAARSRVLADTRETLGVYPGPSGQAGARDFEAYLGRDVGWVTDFVRGDSWDTIANSETIDNWAGTRWKASYSVPMLPEDPSTNLAAGARGAYDGYWRTLAENLVRKGQGDASLRIGWEMAGRWYRWTAIYEPEAFVGYWRNIVTSMRSVPGARFSFDWSTTHGRASRPDGSVFKQEAAYPGDDYVDVISMSTYDSKWGDPGISAAERWEWMLNEDHGLLWHKEFAAAHGKPMAYAEWGLWNRGTDFAGGGDNPYYLWKMREWVGLNNVKYFMYFNADESDNRHHLRNSEFAEASAQFRQLFG